VLTFETGELAFEFAINEDGVKVRLRCAQKRKRPATVVGGPDITSADWVWTLVIGFVGGVTPTK
jgi:hypothetical protein